MFCDKSATCRTSAFYNRITDFTEDYKSKEAWFKTEMKELDDELRKHGETERSAASDAKLAG